MALAQPSWPKFIFTRLIFSFSLSRTNLLTPSLDHVLVSESGRNWRRTVRTCDVEVPDDRPSLFSLLSSGSPTFRKRKRGWGYISGKILRRCRGKSTSTLTGHSLKEILILPQLVSSKQLTTFSDFRTRVRPDFLSTSMYAEYLKEYCSHLDL